MAGSWGKAEYDQIKALQERLQKLQSADLDKFCEACSKELAARLLSLVIERTPIGKYPNQTGKKGGTLRRGWTARSHQEAAGGSGIPNAAQAVQYAQNMHINKAGSTYTIEVINPVEYASYVEFGHRTRDGKGWVNGQYFLTFAEKDLERIAPGVLERKLNAFLKEAFSNL